MKQTYFLRIILPVILFLCPVEKLYAQPPGANMYNAINTGTLSPGVPFTDTRNNSTYNGYGNDMGQPSDDIYYKFTLTSSTDVNVSHCASAFDTYMHLLDVNGNIIASNDDGGPLCSTLQASIRMQLAAGTYYVVSEGYYTNSGNITTSITTMLTYDYDYTIYVDSLMQNLDKSGVTTGILYDRIVPLGSLQDFNKSFPDTSSSGHFIQSYSELYRSAYYNSTWSTVKDLQNQALTNKIQGVVSVGLGNYQLNVIDTNAISLGLIQETNNMYYDVPGRPRHPFQTVNSFVASPLVDSIAGSVVNYQFSSAFIFNKSPLTITSLQVDFNDGIGLRSVSLSSSVTISYSAPGYKYLKFVATFSNSTSVTTYAYVKITEAPGQISGLSCDQQDTFGIWSQLPFQGYDETSATNGYGDVRIYYATNGNCDKILRKPVIVIDGFDPGNSRSAAKLYDEYLNNQNRGKLGDNLRSKGYDIVILNFPQYSIGSGVRDGGADYIERNARVLMALIDTVNSMKQGNEKLVIIGPSMGGLISRYALAYMEQNNMLHNTRLWASFDSPHQGANIPIGDQWFLDFYAKKTGSEKLKANRDGKIGSVAAKQMLVHHYLSNSEYPAGAQDFRDRFVGVLNTIGFPQGDPGQSFRKIALIDGSLGGTEVNSAGQKGFTFDIRRRKTTFFVIRWRSFTVAAAKMYFTPSYGFSGATALDAWYLFSSKVYRVSTPSSTSGYDVAPGGKFNTQGVLYDEGNGEVEKKLLMAFEARFYSVVRDHSFISTKSALAFTGSNQNLSENLSTRNLVCTGETPFNSYFGSFTVNRDHVELWTEGMDWITKEIDSIPQSPSYISNPFISGPDNVCATTNYQVNNLPAGATIIWSVTGNIAISGSSTGSSVNVVSSGSGTGTINAAITSSCGNTNISKAITVGLQTLSVSSYVDRTPQFNDYQYLNATAEQLPGTVAGNYKWYQETNGVRGIQIASGLQLLNYPIPPCATVYYQCVATTACGEAVYRGYAYNTNCGSYAISGSLVAYPNPANTELNINNREEASDAAENGTLSNPVNPEFQVKLYDGKGNILRSAKNPKGNRGVRLDIAEVPDGTYYLHITKGKEVFKKQIIINHQQ